MLGDGFKLLVIGMGMVFVFLTIMVFVMNIAAKVLAPFAHLVAEPQAKPKSSKKSASKQKAAGDDQLLVTAAIAAVHQYRAEHE